MLSRSLLSLILFPPRLLPNFQSQALVLMIALLLLLLLLLSQALPRMQQPEARKCLRYVLLVLSWSSYQNCPTDAPLRSRRGQSALPSLGDDRRLYREAQIPRVP